MAPVPMTPQPADGSSGRLTALAGGIVLVVVACTLAGEAVDVWRKRKAGKSALVPGWAVGMLASSYALLLPGLFVHLFEARTDVVFFGIARNLSAYDETMVSLIGRLGRDRMYLVAILVTLYAVAIPLMKVVLLVLGLRLQTKDARLARRCICIVQAISKWACPDMFAYILLTCLMRGLNKPPTLRSGMTLDLGFTCFSVFCVASTVSSLGIQLPEVPAREAAGTETRVPRRLQGRSAVAAVVALTVAFVCSFAVGLVRPSMSLHMDMRLLYEVRPDLQTMAPVFEGAHLGDLLRKSVGVWECAVSLASWVLDGEVNALIAFVLYAGFAMLLPVVDMALILTATLADLRPDAASSAKRWSSTALALSRKLRKVSMLDVSVMGSFVVVVSLAGMRAKGVIVSAHSGAVSLLVAEACRYAAGAIAQRAHACRDEAPQSTDPATSV